jgi:hypothetical protein
VSLRVVQLTVNGYYKDLTQSARHVCRESYQVTINTNCELRQVVFPSEGTVPASEQVSGKAAGARSKNRARDSTGTASGDGPHQEFRGDLVVRRH